MNALKALRKTLRAAALAFFLTTLFCAAAPAGAAKRAELRVAFYPLAGFFEYDDVGRERGYGVDILNRISMYSGVVFRYIPTDSWEETQKMLLSGKADIRMPGTRPTRKAPVLDYTDRPILDTYHALMALKDRRDLYYRDYENFSVLKVGITRSMYNSQDFQTVLKAINVGERNLVYFDSYNDCRAALESGHIDALVSNIMDLDDEMKQLERLSSLSNYISMTKDNPWLERLNDALMLIDQNEPTFFSETYKKWYPDRVATPLTKEEALYLASLKSLCFSYRRGQGYLSRLSGDGKTFEGFYPSLARLICDKLGVECRQTELTGDDLKTAAIYPDLYYDFGWADENGVDITKPYFTVGYYEITRKNRRIVPEKARVAAVRSFFVTRRYILERYSPDQMVWCENYEECIEAVSSGKADVTYVNSYASEYYLNFYRYSGLSFFLTGFSHQVCLGVLGDATGLLTSSLSKILETLSREQFNALMVESTSQRPEQNIFTEWIYVNPVRSLLLICGFVALTVVLTSMAVYNSRTRRKNAELVRATNAKQDFLARMSHDMRTPMNAIISFSAFGGDSADLAEAREYHGKIQQSARYLLQLINDSLDLSKLQSGKYKLHPEPYWNTDFAVSIATILTPRANEKGVSFELRCDVEKPLALMFDKIRIQQIFVNPLNNAIKFTPQGGHVTLDISNEPLDENTRLVHFRVADDGVGMSHKFQKDNLFKPFEQEGFAGSEEGTGLGLAIVKDLVDLMGGSISCASEPGKGTVFDVFISSKVAGDAGAPEPEENADAGIAALAGKRVLICEDQPLNREIAKKLLKNVGIVVDTARNGSEGVDMLSVSPEKHYSAVLMDIRMPVMDGLAAARAIRALPRRDAKTLPIIALSANAYGEDVAACMKAGMNAHLSKPIEPEKLYNMLVKCLF